MSHFAKVEDGIVTQVIVAEARYVDTIEGTWVQTSYNNSFRKQYAGIGFTYDSTKDKFIVPQPHDSWSLDENDDWQAPVEYPADGDATNWYNWDESVYQGDNTKGWVEV